MIDDRRRIAGAGGAIPAPGFMDERIGHHRQFRHERPHEPAGRILIIALLDRIIDPHRVDAGGAGLHLHLWPVDARFVIHELPRQVQPGFAPRQPQLIAGKRHQHRAHPEIDPAVPIERPHTGIDERIAGPALAPRLQQRRIGMRRAQAIIAAVQVFELQPRFVLQLLHEVTMPVLAPRKRHQRCPPAARFGGGRRINRLEIALPCPCRLGDFAQGQRSPGNMRR